MRKYKIFLLFLLIAAIGGSAFAAAYFRWDVKVQTEAFRESNRAVTAPNRGFYYIYGFVIQENAPDYAQELAEQMSENEDAYTLALIEINLRNYTAQPLTEAALSNIRSLFAAMADTPQQWIVRFLYDWDGKNAETEPQELSIITGHMQQLEEILRSNADCIFTMQGLFIGNWGEMNGTQYTEETAMRTLAGTLVSVTDETTYLSVRTPQQWRIITQTADPADTSTALLQRLGLFNDGMLGSRSDYGTYGESTRAEAGDFSQWTRTEELAFQNMLCQRVPNGGEVIADNSYNDLENAIDDLRTMHVTYLNREYDAAVLDKWALSTVHTDDCFDGMDGLTYIERHLGYRLYIEEAALTHDFWSDTATVSVTLENAGFAPLYRSCTGHLIVKNEDGIVWEQTMQTDGSLTFSAEVPLRGKGNQFSFYFSLTDDTTDDTIGLANEQEPTVDGMLCGKIGN